VLIDARGRSLQFPSAAADRRAAVSSWLKVAEVHEAQ
jgi:hypothetical protein